MADVKFPFDREFQIGILALMTQRYDFLLTSVELLIPEYFEDRVLIWVFKTLSDYYKKHQETPSVHPVVTNELRKAFDRNIISKEDLKNYIQVIEKLPNQVNAQNYVINEVVRFCRRQEGRKVYLETAPLMDTADDDMWDSIIDQITKVANLGNGFLDLGTNYFTDYAERIRQRNRGDGRTVIPTGISDLDLKLNGGLRSGQLGIWLGGTGGGKSIALPHCGKVAVCHGYRVMHYTLELDAEIVADRYDAAWTNTPIHDLKQNNLHVRDKLEWLSNGTGIPNGPYSDRLFIKWYPTGEASINTIKTHLRQMESNGWVPDLVIVDYGDLLKPLTSYNDEYSDLGAIFKDLRGLAGILQVPVWTATQVNRAGMSAEVIDIEHIGDSLKKAQIADVVLAICSTREEREMDLIRLFGAKNRNGPSKFVVEIKSDYSKMKLYDAAATEEYREETGYYTNDA